MSLRNLYQNQVTSRHYQRGLNVNGQYAAIHGEPRGSDMDEWDSGSS